MLIVRDGDFSSPCLATCNFIHIDKAAKKSHALARGRGEPWNPLLSDVGL